MNKNKKTGLIVLINTIVIITICLATILLIRFIYANFAIPRSAYAITILLSCPFVWGFSIFLAIKKKTPGHLITEKLSNKNHK